MRTDANQIVSISTRQDADLIAVKDDIAALKRDVASLIEHLKAGVTRGVQTCRRACRWWLTPGFIATSAADGERAVKSIGERVVKATSSLALLIANGMGYIGGRVLAR